MGPLLIAITFRLIIFPKNFILYRRVLLVRSYNIYNNGFAYTSKADIQAFINRHLYSVVMPYQDRRLELVKLQKLREEILKWLEYDGFRPTLPVFLTG